MGLTSPHKQETNELPSPMISMHIHLVLRFAHPKQSIYQLTLGYHRASARSTGKFLRVHALLSSLAAAEDKQSTMASPIECNDSSGYASLETLLVPHSVIRPSTYIGISK